MKLFSVYLLMSLALSQSVCAFTDCETVLTQQKYRPDLFIAQKIETLTEAIAARPNPPVKSFTKRRQLNIGIHHKDILREIYGRGLVEASYVSGLLADKLIMAKIVQYYLGSDAGHYFPPTLGLKELLYKHRLVKDKGNITNSLGELRRAFSKEFPQGFIVKRALDWGSHGIGILSDPEEFYKLLLLPQSPLYQPSEFFKPYKSKKTGLIASGEKFIVMGKVHGTRLDGDLSGQGKISEYRLHSFHNKVVPGGTTSRWYGKERPGDSVKLEKYINDFLNRLPKKLMLNQAWSFDVFINKNGEMQIIEINTNRGVEGSWSGFLRTGPILGAYVRFFEREMKWHLTGIRGKLLRAGLGTTKAHIKLDIKYAIEEWRNGEEPALIAEDLNALVKNTALPFIEMTKNTRQLKSTKKFVADFVKLWSKVETVGDDAWLRFVKWFELNHTD